MTLLVALYAVQQGRRQEREQAERDRLPTEAAALAHRQVEAAERRALLCNGPNVTINSFDSASGTCEVHGPGDREALLRTLTEWLCQAEAEQPLWPGGTLLPKPHPGAEDES